MNKTKAKQSLMIAALTSSFGIFVSKMIGLLYYSPLSSIAGESNMAFYSITYTYYDLLLKISSAGIPFAMAALVARYYAKEDYKTVLLVKKLGISLIMALSFIVAIIFFFVSTPLAKQSMGSSATASDVASLKTLFMILIVAVILVPYLSAVRGYYQGLKRLDLYGSSQALEQFVRVFNIILLAVVFVKVLKFDSIYAIYMAMASAAIAALITIIFFVFMGKEDDKRINELIKTQTTPGISKNVLFEEILSLGLPYLLISFLGSLGAIINTSFFLDVATKAGLSLAEAKLQMGILQANCNKLCSIPQVLTLGFSAGLVPYLSESLEKKDFNKLNKQIVQLLDTVLYILIPIVFAFFFFGKDIYFIMYGNNNLELSTGLFKVYCLVCFTDTIAPIISSVMITLRLKKEASLTLLTSCVLKLITFFIFVKLLGGNGMTISTAISSLFVIIAYLVILNRQFEIKFMQTFRKLIFILLSAAIAFIPFAIFRGFIPVEYTSRLANLLVMGVFGIATVSIYYLISTLFYLPQTILGINDINPLALLKRFRG